MHIGADQLNWLVGAALDMSGKSDVSEWGIVVCSHESLTLPDSPYNGHTYNTANAIAILTAYQQGASGSVTSDGEDVPYDFTSSPRAQVICCIHGHNHAYQEDELGDAGILSIGCPNAMNGRERESDDGQTYTKTKDSAEDTSFCVISIDRTNHKIYADHYGPGYDREWDYTEPEPGPGYTNQIPLSTDAAGSVYNGVGYKNGTRLNSAGSEVSSSNGVAVGFIPFVKGNILRVRGGQWNGDGNAYIQLFDAQHQLIQAISYSNMSNPIFGTTTFAGDMQYDSATITASGIKPENIRYIRFSCNCTDGSILIATVNEEIT